MTALDTLADGALLPGEHPSLAAFCMAYAFMPGQIPGTGAFGNAPEPALAVGIGKDSVSKLLTMLDKSRGGD